MLVAILANQQDMSRDVRKELVVGELKGSAGIVNGLLDRERYFMCISERGWPRFKLSSDATVAIDHVRSD